MNLWQQVDTFFINKDFVDAVNYLENLLKAENVTRFKGLIGHNFSEPPLEILNGMNEFIDTCKRSFDIQAIYLEMNGFDINYDRWFFDFFGYSRHNNDLENLDWLSEWQSSDWPDHTLAGLEIVQKDFEWYHENKIYEDAQKSIPFDIVPEATQGG